MSTFGFNLEIGGEADFRRVLKDINAQMKVFQSEVGLTSSQFNKNDASLRSVTEQTAAYQKVVDASKEKLGYMNAALEAAQRSYGETSSRTQYWANQVRAAEAELNNANAALNRFNQTQDEGAKSLTALGAAFGTFAGNIASSALSAIGQGISQSIGAIKDVMSGAIAGGMGFEEEFARVKQVTNATDAEFKQLAADISDMSTKLPLTTTELNAIAESAGRLGIAKADLIGFSKVVADLGSTTDLVGDEGATAFAKLAKMLHVNSDEYANMGSSLIYLANNYPTTASQIMEFSNRLAGAGYQAGMTADEVMTLSTILASAGVEAQAGGTAMAKNVNAMNAVASNYEKITAVISATNKSARELEMWADTEAGAFKEQAHSLGLTVSELKSYVEDAARIEEYAAVIGVTTGDFVAKWSENSASAMVMLLDGLKKVGESGESLTEVLARLGIEDSRQVTTFQNLTASVIDAGEAMDASKNAYKEGIELAETAEKSYQTLSAQVKMMGNAWSNLGADMYEAFQGQDGFLTNNVIMVKDWLTELGEALREGGWDAFTEKLDVVMVEVRETLERYQPQINKFVETAIDTIAGIIEASAPTLVAAGDRVMSSVLGAMHDKWLQGGVDNIFGGKTENVLKYAPYSVWADYAQIQESKKILEANQKKLAELGKQQKEADEKRKEQAKATAKAIQDTYRNNVVTGNYEVQKPEAQKPKIELPKASTPDTKAFEDAYKAAWNNAKLAIEEYKYTAGATAEQELEMWQSLLPKYQALSSERIDILKNIQSISNSIEKERVKTAEETEKAITAAEKARADKITDLGKSVTAALKRQYDEQKTAVADRISKELEAVKSGEARKIAEYDKAYAKRLSTLDEQQSKELSAIDAQRAYINGLNESDDERAAVTSYENKLGSLLDKSANAKTIEEINELQRQIDETQLAEQNRRNRKQRAQALANLDEQEKSVRDKYKTQIDALREAKLKELEVEKNAAENKFKALTEAENLQAEALKAMTGGHLEELTALLESYNPNWKLAGQSLGEAFMDGINASFDTSDLRNILDISAMERRANDTVQKATVPAAKGSNAESGQGAKPPISIVIHAQTITSAGIVKEIDDALSKKVLYAARSKGVTFIAGGY